ncbi:N-acetylmuramoyl-L-alanine amidase [Heyndrickxia oleronia]|uniref:N-acetylmuramoyl-L-alanine amidase n=1 Tax=Heyndrickxia oleronia TaxID=38875 RepID=UPI001B0E2D93|nr:N-acetylmuramoyl-L-alanine amidase [Heyndrickxia oleronia]GIN38622.1 N-acetylmuramoyl-L-alanine amidase [Heyndrickxia oleronia]
MIKRSFILFTLIVFITIGSIQPFNYVQAESTVKVEVEVLNIREGPGLSYPIIHKGKIGETYGLLQEKQDWYEIQLENGQKGWVADYFVSVDEQQKHLESNGIVTVDGLNIRSTPNLSGNIIGKLNAGEAIQILNESKDWIQISIGNRGQKGWVSRQYIMFDTKNEMNTPQQLNVTIIHNGTNLRSQPSTSSPIVGKGSSGDSYTVVETKNNWYKIQLSNGNFAYVASWVVLTTMETIQDNDKKKEKGLKGKIIVIDPGHGGRDSGTIGFSGTFEKDITLQTAEMLKNKLKEDGAIVYLTREKDAFVPLPARVNLSTIHRADAFISLHYDSIDDQSVVGHTSYYYHSYQKILAENINNGISNILEINNRGVRFGDFHVIRENTQPAVLLELGYLSNPVQEASINSKKYQELMTDGIYNGLVNYFN